MDRSGGRPGSCLVALHGRRAKPPLLPRMASEPGLVRESVAVPQLHHRARAPVPDIETLPPEPRVFKGKATLTSRKGAPVLLTAAVARQQLELTGVPAEAVQAATVGPVEAEVEAGA